MKEVIKKNFPFKDFRPNQEAIIERILKGMITEKKTNFIFEGPTGTGKSVIGWAVGKSLLELAPITSVTRGKLAVSKPSIIICTSSKQLQKQYIDTFSKFGAEFIWSSKNYECINPHLPKEDEVHYGANGCLKKRCKDFEDCPYIIQKRKFQKAKIGITNYHYLLHTTEINPHILICDEAHNLQKLLCDSHSVKLSEKIFERLHKQISNAVVSFKISLNDILLPFKLILKENLEELERFKLKEYTKILYNELNEYKILINNEIKVLENSLEDYPNGFEDKDVPEDFKKQYLNVYKAETSLSSFLKKLKSYNDSESEWVLSELDPIKKTIQVKPLEVKEGMSDLIKRSNYILYLSATICGPQQFAKELGLDFNTCDYIESPCIFPVQNRQVFLNYIGSMNYKNKDEMLPKFVNGIDIIVNKVTTDFTKNISGIIHTVSYANAEYIKKTSKYKRKIIIPTKDDLLELDKIIKDSKKGLIICSPSIMEGVDLVDDLSRFQIWLKIPYGFLGDRWINTKMTRDPDWYARETVIKIVQGCGRSIRSMDDWAHTFILDSTFNRLIGMNKKLFPHWFLESITNQKD